MNLPQTAIDFLDVFRGYLYTSPAKKGGGEGGGAGAIGGVEGGKGGGAAQQQQEAAEPELELEELPEGRRLPMIHVYCFEKEPENDEVGLKPPAAHRTRQRTATATAVVVHQRTLL